MKKDSVGVTFLITAGPSAGKVFIRGVSNKLFFIGHRTMASAITRASNITIVGLISMSIFFLAGCLMPMTEQESASPMAAQETQFSQSEVALISILNQVLADRNANRSDNVGELTDQEKEQELKMFWKTYDDALEAHGYPRGLRPPWPYSDIRVLSNHEVEELRLQQEIQAQQQQLKLLHENARIQAERETRLRRWQYLQNWNQQWNPVFNPQAGVYSAPRRNSNQVIVRPNGSYGQFMDDQGRQYYLQGNAFRDENGNIYNYQGGNRWGR